MDYFITNLKTTLRRYATFRGVAGCGEFWCWVLFAVALVGGLFTLCWFIDKPLLAYILWAVCALLLIPSFAVTVRRLHDTGRSGWWVFLWGFILVGTVLFGFLSGYLLQGMSPGDTVSPFTSVFFPVLSVAACIYSLLMLFWLASPGKTR